MDPSIFTRKIINYNNFYEDVSKDIVFKVYNFKKSVTKIKSKARHLLSYNLNSNLGYVFGPILP